MRHKHYELIIQWAEGAQIEIFDGKNWQPSEQPEWLPNREYRIKPAEPKWYDNISPKGVLCWVSHDTETPTNQNHLDLIVAVNTHDFKSNRHVRWRYATPLTNQEIKEFLR